jgi:hypothetical protein
MSLASLIDPPSLPPLHKNPETAYGGFFTAYVKGRNDARAGRAPLHSKGGYAQGYADFMSAAREDFRKSEALRLARTWGR